ncbi:hypothetical protein AMTRI_Chr02g213260 [Amborella trichopoda]|uniref:Uncharacterized protein n=1 Tax=Amborella trichopoda TaxID=13333 RepID=U5D3D5_AMBTC|nr:protein unc-45 homolog A [Amborella trichopoda]ERN14878.1 hypothetical protein AMTR_s00032p00156640 [Amborella trichopoda]|eukprot:XP_006853411.1 protein unc-45 homolog A [Amborella trichopoda]
MASGLKIDRAHQMYREGQHEEALGLYTEALAMAKTKAQRIALHSNRAACYLKLQEFKKAAEECSAVLELDHKHTGALMLRAQTLVTLKDYHSALFDVNRLIELNPSSDVYWNLQTRLKTQLSLAPIPESEEEAMAAEPEEEEIAIEPEEVEAAVRVSEDEATKAKFHGNDSQSSAKGNDKDSPDLHPRGWESIPKPKGHSGLDYSRWDRVEDDSSDEEEEEDEPQPQYRFRVRTVGVRPVK